VRIGLDRRSFLKLSGAAAGSVAAGEIFGRLALDQIVAEEVGEDGTRILTVACNNNCGGRCHLKAHIMSGQIVRISTDELPDSDARPQLRACLKGRALRNRLHHPDRLLYPMKRVGRRGEGRFQRISWGEAIDSIAANLKGTLDRFGPMSVYIQYGTGDCGAISGVAAARRLMNLLGGYLGYYNSYSSACLRYTAPFVTGYRDTSSYQTLVHSKLIVLNGFNPAETVFETNSNYYLGKARDAGARIVVIDPRLTETAATFADQWLPLKPTTDTALFVAMAHVIISENLHDQAFLDKHCIGLDEAHMPPGVPEGQSFKSYVLGLSDRIPKTPEWAAPITGIDAATIRALARDYATAKPAQLLQGLGPQRHAHGEQSVRAGIVLACMTGNLGILGGGWGGGEGGRVLGLGVGELPTGVNPVKARIPVFMWTDVIVRGRAMTADDGVKDGPLASNIKFIFNLASNTLVNQHADIHRTIEILQNEMLVECIVVSDQFMTPSARFADILLPADNSLERSDIGFPWSGEKYVVFGNKVVEPPGECRNEYSWLAQIAQKLGVGEKFTEGKTREDWLKQIVAEAGKATPGFPAYEDLKMEGVYREPPQPYVAFEREINDPAGHPFNTPSGKIEIFSKTLYDMHKPDITGIPTYIPAWEGPEDALIRKYPLQCIGPHYKRRTHSTFDENAWMEEADPQVMWISPQDAGTRGIVDGAKVRAFNDRGALIIRAHITKRVRPGVVAIPQGAWYTPDSSGVCQRGCINILTSQRPTPLAHGNAQHTILVEVQKIDGGSGD
jgi:anaerobic dimethyl sulfoxide reductase subunit A